MLDDPVFEQRSDRGELRLARHFWINAVQLPQTDLIDAELLAALDRLLPQALGAPVHLPHPSAGAPEPALGGDENAVIRVQRFADQLLGHVRAVRVRSVDEIDPELGHAFQRPECLRFVGGRSPDAGAGDPHRAEAKAVDVDTAANLE